MTKFNEEEIIAVGICPQCGDLLTHNDREPVMKEISCPSDHFIIEVSYKFKHTQGLKK